MPTGIISMDTFSFFGVKYGGRSSVKKLRHPFFSCRVYGAKGGIMRIKIYENNGSFREFFSLKEALKYVKKEIGFFAYLKAKRRFLKRKKTFVFEKFFETEFGFGAGITCFKTYGIYVL